MSESLVGLLNWLRDDLSQIRLTYPLPGVDDTRHWINDTVIQLDDYMLPRLRSVGAPLLAVVGGSTGSGKSTLVNSLIHQEVTAPGVIRPTTKAPVLVHHPEDASWFTDDRILPGLVRSHTSTTHPRSLQLVSSTAVPRGLALLDAPDIDSVDDSNRSMAAQLLAAADLWLFVTSAARYADAVPWEYLNQAAGRAVVMAVVVDRVPPEAREAVPEHLAQMMAQRGLGDAPLFVVPEIPLEVGMLPPDAVDPIRQWLRYLASNQITRAQVVMHTLDGALAAVERGIGGVAEQISTQNQVGIDRRNDVIGIFAESKTLLRSRSSNGTLLRGEVLTRWQDFVGTGAMMRSVETWIGRLRDRVTRLFVGETPEALQVQIAVKSGLEMLILETGRSSVERVRRDWSNDHIGRFLLDGSQIDLLIISSEYATQVEQAIRSWQDDVMDLVRQEGSHRRSRARLAAFGVNAVGVCLMLVVFAYTAGVSGAEIGIAGGTAVVAQKLLELIFGDDAIRRLAKRAHAILGERMDGLLDDLCAQVLAMTVDRFPTEPVSPKQLSRIQEQVAQARDEEIQRLNTAAIADTELETDTSQAEDTTHTSDTEDVHG